MFEGFGEFGSCEELNEAAQGFLEEGDIDSLFAMATENGIDREDVQDFIDGYVTELTTGIQAAIGRLEVHKKHIVRQNKNVAERMACGIMLSILATMVMEKGMADAIMEKGKSVAEVYKAMAEEAKKHASGSGQERMAVSCGTDQELRGILRAYYLEPKKLRKEIAALYVFGGEDGNAGI